MHRVVRTIKGRQYAYEEESYRIPGVKTPRKRSRYLGPVDPRQREDVDVDPLTGKRRKKGLAGFISNLVRSGAPWEETEAQLRERLTEQDRKDWRKMRNNELLTAPTISLRAIKEIADSQVPERRSATAPDRVSADEFVARNVSLRTEESSAERGEASEPSTGSSA